MAFDELTQNLTIERLAKKDLDQLVAVAQQTWLETFTQGLGPSDIEEAMRGRNHQHFLSAMDDDQIWLGKMGDSLLGFVHFGASHVKDTNPEDIEIRKLYVIKHHQNHGIGRKLMNFALNDPSAKGKQVYLDVWSENQKAIRLYQSLGFSVISERFLQTENGPSATPDYIMKRTAVGGDELGTVSH